MGKGRRHNITRSLDAYLSEDHVEDQNAQKTATSSPIQPGTTEGQLDTETSNEFVAPVDMSKANRINCSKKKGRHTTGTKSFARKREELKDKDSGKKYPHRAVLYIHTHQSNSNKNTNPHAGALQELITEHPDLADNSEGKIAWKGDALTRILGEEKPGHVHGMGLVPNPNKVLECSTSSKLKQLNLTSVDATSSEDVVSLKLQMEKLVNHVQAQDAAIQKLQQKTVPLEQNQRQPEHLDEPLSETNDVQPTGKRKRVYSELHGAEFSMLQDVNDTTMDKIEDEGSD